MLLAFILAGIAPLYGQDQSASAADSGAFATDRPSVANSSVVVPLGSIQLENGFLEASGQGQSLVDGPETEVRVGVASRTKLRLTARDYYRNLSATGVVGSPEFPPYSPNSAGLTSPRSILSV
jgi:hypothetical protein